MLSSEISTKPKVCVVGCGAIGGLLAAKMINAGHDVLVIERGVQFSAIRKHGLKLHFSSGKASISVSVNAVNHFDGGVQDIIFLAVKAHQIPSIAQNIHKLMHPATRVVTLQNGLPWWYFQKFGGEHEGRVLESLDPNGLITRHIEPGRLIGCVAYPAAEVQSPGVIRHIEGDRFPIGEIDGAESTRLGEISLLLESSGFKSPCIKDIRNEVWLKLWGVLAFNPVSMLTRATLVEICSNKHTRQLVTNMMREAEKVANQLGVTFRVPLEKRISGAERVGAHKTSTLQDLEAGNPTELEAILGSVIELGRLLQIKTPNLDVVYANCKLLEQVMLANSPANLRIRLNVGNE